MSSVDDPFELERFLKAQERVYESVLRELRGGRKRGHWIWFVFPQLEGLGWSHMSRRYGIGSLDEAKAYLAHPILGERLRECTRLVNAIEGRSVDQIFGYPDNLKFRSCMTLFQLAEPEDGEFGRALEKYFDGMADDLTLEKLGLKPSS